MPRDMTVDEILLAGMNAHPWDSVPTDTLRSAAHQIRTNVAKQLRELTPSSNCGMRSTAINSLIRAGRKVDTTVVDQMSQGISAVSAAIADRLDRGEHVPHDEVANLVGHNEICTLECMEAVIQKRLT
jgi:hypothetical protein